MADFYEIWDLRNKLIAEGYYTPSANVANGHEEEEKIWKLAREHYGWEPPEPDPMPRPDKKYEESLMAQTCETRLKHIYEIALDWDGYRGCRGLGSLIDEIIACTVPKCMSDTETLEQVKLTKMYDGIPDFLSSRVSSKSLPFTWNFAENDVWEVLDWSDKNGYKAMFRDVNYSSKREIIGCAITITKEDEEEDAI